jgi:hypothetical protein
LGAKAIDHGRLPPVAQSDGGKHRALPIETGKPDTTLFQFRQCRIASGRAVVAAMIVGETDRRNVQRGQDVGIVSGAAERIAARASRLGAGFTAVIQHAFKIDECKIGAAENGREILANQGGGINPGHDCRVQRNVAGTHHHVAPSHNADKMRVARLVLIGEPVLRSGRWRRFCQDGSFQCRRRAAGNRLIMGLHDGRCRENDEACEKHRRRNRRKTAGRVVQIKAAPMPHAQIPRYRL